jgi:hypothetical protein
MSEETIELAKMYQSITAGFNLGYSSIIVKSRLNILTKLQEFLPQLIISMHCQDSEYYYTIISTQVRHRDIAT